MAEPMQPATAFSRWLIDRIYGHPKAFGFFIFVGVLGLAWVILLASLWGVPLASQPQDASPSLLGRALGIALSLPLLPLYPWFAWRQWDNRRIYRRMYGSFYDRR